MTLKTESYHAKFVVTRDIGGCHYDNIWCPQWQQSWYHDDYQVIRGHHHGTCQKCNPLDSTGSAFPQTLNEWMSLCPTESIRCSDFIQQNGKCACTTIWYTPTVIARPPHQPPVILSGTPEVGLAPLTCGCWPINYISANIGHRNSIRILNQYPFWWNILIRS